MKKNNENIEYISAKQLFEELGFVLLKEKNDNIPRKSWNFTTDSLVFFRKGDMVIKFLLCHKRYKTIEYYCGDDSDREHDITMKLQKAINRQLNELRWLDEE